MEIWNLDRWVGPGQLCLQKSLGEEAAISLFPKHADAAELVKQQGIRSATAASLSWKGVHSQKDLRKAL